MAQLVLIIFLGKFNFEEKKTLQQGCSTTLVAALDPSIRGISLPRVFIQNIMSKNTYIDYSGSYLADADIAKEQPKPASTDPETAEQLWGLSEKLVGQNFAW
jgi:hypothetical protein